MICAYVLLFSWGYFFSFPFWPALFWFQWAYELGHSGEEPVHIPLHACEHFYLLTHPLKEPLSSSLPSKDSSVLFTFLGELYLPSKVTCSLWQKGQPRVIGPQLIWDCEVLSELLWISFFSGSKNIFLYSCKSFSYRKLFWEFINLTGEWPWL